VIVLKEDADLVQPALTSEATTIKTALYINHVKKLRCHSLNAKITC
jgi:hypothetical protein